MMKREVKESKSTIMITHDERMLDVCDAYIDASR